MRRDAKFAETGSNHAPQIVNNPGRKVRPQALVEGVLARAPTRERTICRAAEDVTPPGMARLTLDERLHVHGKRDTASPVVLGPLWRQHDPIGQNLRPLELTNLGRARPREQQQPDDLAMVGIIGGGLPHPPHFVPPAHPPPSPYP